MPWIGVECRVGPDELLKWSLHLKSVGAARVAGFLEDVRRLIGAETLGTSEIERMRELEFRAADALERKRAEVSAKAAAIIGRVMGEGVDPSAVFSAAGLDGWRDGDGAKGKNGGVNRKRRAYSGHGSAVAGKDGRPSVLAQKGKAPVSAAETAARDRRYGESFEGWCAVELRKSGFKMSHVARGLGMTVAEVWRSVSGWERHWKRQRLHGKPFPGPGEGWEDRRREAADLAMGLGVKGRKVVLNGTGTAGVEGLEVADE